MNEQMDEQFSAALRGHLVEQVITARPQSRWFSGIRRWAAGTGVVLVLAGTGGGIAWATGAFSPPGAQITTPLASPVVGAGTGSGTVDLGSRPAGVDAVAITFTCLTPGRFLFPDGSSAVCRTAHDVDSLQEHPLLLTEPLPSGQTTIRIRTSTRARWRLTATYASLKTTPWGVNARGQTYGVANSHGTPDLVAVIATNGRRGYCYAAQLQNGPSGRPPKTPKQALARSGLSYTLTVYASDGKTAIGQFKVGP